MAVSVRPPRRPERVRVVCLVVPDVHLLDLAGPAQVFFEANAFGGRYELLFCAVAAEARSMQGLLLGDLQPLPEPAATDLVLAPGMESTRLDALQVPGDWLRAAAAAGARVCSICSGAFLLARAGLLDGRQCTTHWKLTARLQREHPAARVLPERLYVHDGPISTSAGVASGIDVALSIVEEDYGPLVAARVAREIVVFMRRSGERDQSSVYLDYRTHLHPGVHRVQDWLVAHPDANPSLEQLARIAGLSPRHLTRRFRELTGISLKEYSRRLKLEVAQGLLHDPTLTVEGVAGRCGFADARQLRRLWRRTHGQSPAAWRGC